MENIYFLFNRIITGKYKQTICMPLTFPLISTQHIKSAKKMHQANHVMFTTDERLAVDARDLQAAQSNVRRIDKGLLIPSAIRCTTALLVSAEALNSADTRYLSGISHYHHPRLRFINSPRQSSRIMQVAGLCDGWDCYYYTDSVLQSILNPMPNAVQ